MIKKLSFSNSNYQIFHVFNKSIAGFKIFNSRKNATRFIETLDFYKNKKTDDKFSRAKKFKKYFYQDLLLITDLDSKIKILSYCIMPDHYHLLIKTSEYSFLSKYINDVENSYSRYFNIKFNRKGPLWQGRFKAVKINNNEQLLHVSRYIHLNPTTANLVKKPEDWQFSSYRQIISDKKYLNNILIEISIKYTHEYKRFTENNINYQKKLKIIKKLIFE